MSDLASIIDKKQKSKPEFWPTSIAAENKMLFEIIQAFELSQWWPKEKLVKLQNQQLASLLNYAKANTPYYSETLNDFSTFTAEGMNEELIASLPLTYKEDIQQDASRFVVRNHEPRYGNTFDFDTSGSVGTPLTVKWNQYANTFTRAKTFRYHQWNNSDPLKKWSSLRVLPLDKDGTTKDVRGRNWYPLLPGGESVSQTATSTIAKQIEWLRKENPHYLFTYASNANALVQFADEHNIALPALERIDCYGETMIDGFTQRAKAVFGCNVADKYSSREMGESATLCPESGLYHIQSETTYLEVRKDDGSQAKEGEIGQLIVTNLHNTAMPIIRYAIEDYAEVGPTCSCGRGLPTLRRIMGRTRNMLVLENGDKLWPRFSSHQLHKIAPIKQIQLIQKTIKKVLVKIVPQQTLTEEDKTAICDEIWTKFPKEIDLKLECVAEIPRTKGGKFEDFRCEID